MSTIQEELADRLISTEEVLSILGVGRTKLSEMIAKGEFPRPHRLGTKRVWSQLVTRKWVKDFFDAPPPEDFEDDELV